SSAVGVLTKPPPTHSRGGGGPAVMLSTTDQLACMAGDLLVFLRGNDSHRAVRCVVADRVARPSIPRLVEADADPRQAVADSGTRLPIMFADPAGEDDEVDAVKRRDHRGDLLSYRITEHLNGQPCIGV